MPAMTPTQKGSMFAGVGVWTLMWATFFKIDKIPFLSRLINKEKITAWINCNKTITLLFTEIFNFGVHGVSKPESVLFALGGTAVNASMIYLFIPFRQSRADSNHAKQVLKKGAAA